MAKRDPNEMVFMAHPDLKTTGGPVTLEALELLYEPKGWYEIDAEERVLPIHETNETDPLRIDNKEAAAKRTASKEAKVEAEKAEAEAAAAAAAASARSAPQGNSTTGRAPQA